jgi:hypothetical protein
LGNQAVHCDGVQWGGGKKGLCYFVDSSLSDTSKSAREVVRGLHEITQWFHGQLMDSHPLTQPYRLVRSRPSPDGRPSYYQVRQWLDEAESAMESRSHMAEAEDFLGNVRRHLTAGVEADAYQRDLLELRSQSLELALRTHQGRVGEAQALLRAADNAADLARRIAESGHAEGWDEVAHYWTRRGSSLIDLFELDEAESMLSKVMEWRERLDSAQSGVFGTVCVRSYQTGCLYGTYGRLMACLAHQRRDMGDLDVAMEALATATQHFTSDRDLEIQANYRAQAILERRRLDPSYVFTDDERSALREALDRGRAALEARMGDTPTTLIAADKSFRLALALKVAYVAGPSHPELGFPESRALAENLLDSPEQTDHPMEQVFGFLIHVHKGDASVKHRQRLGHIAKQQPDLVGWIAATHELEQKFRQAPLKGLSAADIEAHIQRLPEAVRGRWAEVYADRFKKACGPHGEGPLSILPFNCF